MMKLRSLALTCCLLCPLVSAAAAPAYPQRTVRIVTAEAGGGTDNELCLELAFREREPTDRSVVAAIRESVAYWAPYTNTGYNR